jgi:hypothetical protein
MGGAGSGAGDSSGSGGGGGAACAAVDPNSGGGAAAVTVDEPDWVLEHAVKSTAAKQRAEADKQLVRCTHIVCISICLE